MKLQKLRRLLPKLFGMLSVTIMALCMSVMVACDPGIYDLPEGVLDEGDLSHPIEQLLQQYAGNLQDTIAEQLKGPLMDEVMSGVMQQLDSGKLDEQIEMRMAQAIDTQLSQYLGSIEEEISQSVFTALQNSLTTDDPDDPFRSTLISSIVNSDEFKSEVEDGLIDVDALEDTIMSNLTAQFEDPDSDFSKKMTTLVSDAVSSSMGDYADLTELKNEIKGEMETYVQTELTTLLGSVAMKNAVDGFIQDAIANGDFDAEFETLLNEMIQGNDFQADLQAMILATLTDETVQQQFQAMIDSSISALDINTKISDAIDAIDIEGAVMDMLNDDSNAFGMAIAAGLLTDQTFLTGIAGSLLTDPSFVNGLVAEMLDDDDGTLVAALLANDDFVSQLTAILVTDDPTDDTDFFSLMATSLLGDSGFVNELVSKMMENPFFSEAIVEALMVDDVFAGKIIDGLLEDDDFSEALIAALVADLEAPQQVALLQRLGVTWPSNPFVGKSYNDIAANPILYNQLLQEAMADTDYGPLIIAAIIAGDNVGVIVEQYFNATYGSGSGS